MKKIIFIFTIILTLTFMFNKTVLANSNNSYEKVQQDKRGHVFTKEQKALIDKKSKELKDKYLKNYEKMTTDERNKAIEKYRIEIRKYIKDEFGVTKDFKPQDPLEKFDVDKYLRKFIQE
ncbi:MAG: hypothetical protein K0Q49_431 [Haloplasmataceae bacterium]|jgi:hypothetical protein|nr:hypothetical protein [Haloplasmataceae bacterium]